MIIFIFCLTFSNPSSGVYQISIRQNQVMSIYCGISSISGCSGGGWTTVMKIDGTNVRMQSDYDVIIYTNQFKFGA